MINDLGGLPLFDRSWLPADHHGADMLDLGLLDWLENCQEFFGEPSSMVCDFVCNDGGVAILGVSECIFRGFELGPDPCEPCVEDLGFELFIPLAPFSHRSVANVLGFASDFEGCAEPDAIDDCLNALGGSKGRSSHELTLNASGAARDGLRERFGGAFSIFQVAIMKSPRPRYIFLPLECHSSQAIVFRELG